MAATPVPTRSRLTRIGLALLLSALCAFGTVAAPAVASAAPVRISAGKFTAAATPKVTGTAVIGATLRVAVGTWTPAPTTLSYVWKRSGKAIGGATKSWYTLTTADVGKTITVTVTGKRSGVTTVTKTSAPTRAVGKAVTYANCTALNRVYPHGVAKVGGVDRVSGRGTGATGFLVSNALYSANAKSDRDKDGVACEKK